MTKDQILAALPALKRADLEAIQATAQALLGGRVGAVEQPACPLATAYFEALSSALNVNVSHARAGTTKAGKLFEKKLPDLTRWLDENFEGWSSKKVSQQAFLGMLFDLLVSDLKRQGLPRSFGVAVSNLDRIPKVFENAFPNYIRSGLQKVILKSFMQA